jgi:adenine-specific DNA-methyltransferase
VTTDFTPIADISGVGEARSNLDVLASLFPDAMVDGRVDLDVLRDLLGEEAEPAGTEAFGLRWPGMSEARRLSTLPATGTLLPKPDESVDWDRTKNIVIEGDNLEVLRLLRRGYTSKVDVIYIDPPYNTGNDFVYDDSRMSTIAEYEADAGLRDGDGATQVGEGSDRAQDRRAGASKHAKWLSMMYPRLLVAHNLLKETGVIIAAIDDTEHARLKLLLDRVFGAENFLANVVWQGGGSNDARYTAGGIDYMLIYAKSRGALDDSGVRWQEIKRGHGLLIEAGMQAWLQSGRNPDSATSRLRSWIRENEDKIERGLLEYNKIDQNGRIYRRSDLRKPSPTSRSRYDVIHPATGKPVAMHPNGWVFAPERMEEMVEQGRILWGPDHTTSIGYKRFLDETEGQAIRPVFTQERRYASQALESLLDADVFPFPKDVSILSKWINAVSGEKSDPIVLDFFAGSGSTGHAVMDLNAADGASRRYVLVQLDEAVNRDGYATIGDVARERLRRAGSNIAADRALDATEIDLGFRSYRLASSNIRPWDGTADQLDLLAAVDNLAEGRSTEDLLVEMMLRLGVDLTTPVEKREVAGSPLYNLGGSLYAYFGTEVTTERSNEVTKALVAWRDEEPADSDITVVVRDTGFVDSSAKLNLAAALSQAGFTTLRSI